MCMCEQCNVAGSESTAADDKRQLISDIERRLKDTDNCDVFITALM